MTLGRRLASEFTGTALLLIAVVGSGIMGERLAAGNVAVALLANSLATAGALYALIRILGPVSGAHFNPLVTWFLRKAAGLSHREVAAFCLMQFAGAILGVLAAHLMFDLPLLQESRHVRTGLGQWSGEVIATVGLLLVIAGCVRHASAAVAGSVAAYIGGAYWFTSSTSFANPAVTVARALTDTFAGIRPTDVPGFMAAQIAGMLAAMLLAAWLFGDQPNRPVM